MWNVCSSPATIQPDPLDRTYQLWVSVDRELKLQVGRLGLLSFPPGHYVYTGSARRHLAARLARHLATDKRPHWHIDHLLAAPGVDIRGTRTFAAPECEVNRATTGDILIARFGATDCRSGCGSHLKYLGASGVPAGQAAVRDGRSIAEVPKNLHLVNAEADDAERLAAMARDIWQRYYFPHMLSGPEVDYLWHRTYRPEALRAQMRSGSVFRWIEQGGVKIGFLAYRLEANSDLLWLSKLYLLPEHHRRGIGGYALAKVKHAAAALGAREIRLYVFKKNQQAIRAYRRAGFEIACDDYSDAGNGFYYDDYVMSLRLDIGREDREPPESP